MVAVQVPVFMMEQYPTTMLLKPTFKGHNAKQPLRNRPLRIYLADLAYNNRLNRHTRHIPKNIGYIAAYAKKIFGGEIDIQLFKDADTLLDAITQQPPDILGFSFYFWNTNLNHTVVKLLRAQYGKRMTIIWGGASVDVDALEEKRLFQRFPEVDAFVPSEGELGFAAIVQKKLSQGDEMWSTAIDGVIHTHEDIILKGAEVGLSLDLAELPSPYLSGLLDPFLHTELLPGFQTSRLCPYSCSFCVSGKNRGKLRGFLIDQLKEEIDFIGRHFADRPHMTLHINDENFGILPRDAEIAEHIVASREKWGYPQSVYFYHDKRLTKTTKRVLKSLAPFSAYGMTMSLQTENPKALEAAKRQAVSPEKLSEAIAWASENNLQTTTELIFGLPGETVKSFSESLNTAIFRGFDSVLCNNLFIVDGIELNRAAERKRLGIVTRFRQVRENYGMVKGQFCAEVEEVVVSTNSFAITGFLDVRKIGMMFYACFNMRFHYWLISHFKHLGLNISKLMLDILNPNQTLNGCARDFALDLERMALNELHETTEELMQKLKDAYIANGNKVGEASQLNILFGARLIYQEREWIDDWVMSRALQRLPSINLQDVDICRFLIGLYRSERINILTLSVPAPMETVWDVLAWRKEKFQKPLTTYALDKPLRIKFSLKPTFVQKLTAFQSATQESEGLDLYVNLLQTIEPRSDLLMQLDYE